MLFFFIQNILETKIKSIVYILSDFYKHGLSEIREKINEIWKSSLRIRAKMYIKGKKNNKNEKEGKKLKDRNRMNKKIIKLT